MENGKSIYRTSQFDRDAEPGSTVEFIPTNSHGYIVTVPNQKAFHPMWNPMAEDLLADDWEVVGYENKNPQTTHGSERYEVLNGHWNESKLTITIVKQSKEATQ